MPSSVVANFKYNAATSVLRVFFISGRVYDYLRVPDGVYQDMKQSASKGAFLNLHIKGAYRFKKVK